MTTPTDIAAQALASLERLEALDAARADHVHYHRDDLGAWWCETTGTLTDYCADEMI